MTELPPIARIAPGVLIVSGPALDAIRYAATVATRSRARNGLPPSSALTALLAATGQSDETPTPAEHDMPHDVLTTAQAAQALGVSERTARRLAPALGGRLIAGRWALDARAVTEHLEAA